MKTCVLLNNKYEGIPLYVALLIFKHECRDDIFHTVPDAFVTANNMVIAMDVRADDSDSAYPFSEQELRVAVMALSYVLREGIVLVDRSNVYMLIEKLNAKLEVLVDATEVYKST